MKRFTSKENLKKVWDKIMAKLSGKLDNPEGGKVGQVLTKTDNGVAWGAATIVKITKSEYDAGQSAGTLDPTALYAIIGL